MFHADTSSFEWLKCLDDFELELLKPYLSIELMREICK